MLSLSRSLFDDLFSLHRELENLFERSWGHSARLLPTLGGQHSSFYPEVESFTKDGKIVYRLRDMTSTQPGAMICATGSRS